MLKVIHKKKKILVFIGHYLPGFKSGGILRSVENTVNHLGNEFDFLIVTRDHDFGDDEPYPEIIKKQWQDLGMSKVFYLDSKSTSFRNLCDLVNATSHDLIHLNSFFDPLTVKILLAKKLKKIISRPILLSPRGEFAWASLKIKYLKKYLYLTLSKCFRFYEDIYWHSSSKYESRDIVKVMNIDENNIHIAKDLPIRIDCNVSDDSVFEKQKACDSFRVVFISRISPEKNLDYAINTLSNVRSKVVFDIYGIIENKGCWNKCQKLISLLPENIKVNYCGVISPDRVVSTLSKYDLFLFPSGGENYGHVIAESLSAGTPVLISQNTPWRKLEQDGFGWDVNLNDMNAFVDIIDKLALMSDDELELKRAHIRNNIQKVLLNNKDIDDNKQLFIKILS